MPASSEASALAEQALDCAELLTPDEAAAEAGKSRQTIYNWINNKKNPLKASKPGREWRIRRGDLIEYMLQLAEAAQAEEERATGADVHTPQQQQPQPEATKRIVVTGRFNIKPVPPPSREVDASADFELLIQVGEIALKIRRYTYAALAARKVNDLEWAERLEEIVIYHENELMETIAPMTGATIAELRTIVRTTPIKNMFQKFEVSLKARA
jgi:excisionase family DNA binding protein